MSFETLLWVRTQRTGNAASRSVLRVLADHAGQDHSCYLRTRLICSETELSASGVRKALASLVQAGLIRVYERYSSDGGRRSNRYQLLPDGVDTPEPDAEDWADVRQAPESEPEGGVQQAEGDPPQQVEVFPTPEASREEAPPVKGRAPRSTATRIPDNFAPDEKMRAWFVAEKLGAAIDGRIEHEKFMDYWRAKPGAMARKLDWPATWRNWMRTAAARAGGTGHVRPVSSPPGTSVMPYTGPAPLGAYRPSTTDQKVSQTLDLGRRLQEMEDSK